MASHLRQAPGFRDHGRDSYEETLGAVLLDGGEGAWSRGISLPLGPAVGEVVRRAGWYLGVEGGRVRSAVSWGGSSGRPGIRPCGRHLRQPRLTESVCEVAPHAPRGFLGPFGAEVSSGHGFLKA